MKKQQNNLANHANPNFANFLALGFVFMVIFDLVYALMRVAMVHSNIESVSFFSADLAQMFIMGARFDMRVVCIFVAIMVLLGYVASANRAIFVKITNRGGAADLSAEQKMPKSLPKNHTNPL